FEWQKIFLHANGIANDQTVARWDRNDASVFRDPVRATENFTLVENQIAIVRQGEAGQAKTATGAQPVRPPRQHLLQVMVHEWVFQHVSGTIGNQCTVGDRVLTAGVLRVGFLSWLDYTLRLLRAKKFEKVSEVVLFPSLPKPLDFSESVWLDLKLNRVFRCMF